MDGHDEGSEGMNDEQPARRQRQTATLPRELLRKFFWFAVIALTVTVMFGALQVQAGPVTRDSFWRSFLEALRELDRRIRENGHEGAPALFVMLLIFLGLMLMPMAKGKKNQGMRSMLGAMVIGTAVIGLGGYMLPARTLWGWALAAIPTMLVVHHALYLRLIKPRFFDGSNADDASNPDKAIHALLQEEQVYFDPSNIALRYGIPALALFAVASLVFHSLNPVTEWALNATLNPAPQTSLDKLFGFLFEVPAQTKEWITYPTLEAARFGALGAYIYVLLYLGQRGFQHDLSSGSVLWCAVTLAVGPLMAAAFSKVWIAGTGATSTAGWATQALYLAIGMTPRYTAQQISLLTRRLGSHEASASLPDRVLPLSLLRGITPRIAERLIEDGIDDVVALAMANPVRIQRSTNFDKRQILTWIDAALLVHALPKDWQGLEDKGIRGVRDFLSYKDDALEQPLLRAQERLREDAQVKIIQMLYDGPAALESPPSRTPPKQDFAATLSNALNTGAAPLAPVPGSSSSGGTEQPSPPPPAPVPGLS